MAIPNPPSNGDGQLAGYGQPQLPQIPEGTPGTYGGGTVPGASSAPGGGRYNPNDPNTWGSVKLSGNTSGSGLKGSHPLADLQTQSDDEQTRQLRNGWGLELAGNKPWLNRYQSAAETRSNYYYGGSANGARDFAGQVGMAGQAQATGYNQLAGGIQQGQAQAGDGQRTAGDFQAAAAGRKPAAFLDRQSMGEGYSDRDRQLATYGGLQNFVAKGPGPSAAQAQLRMATDTNMGNALALSRSGRGMGGSAAGLRQAIGQNAQTQQMAGNQSAMLRAQEDQSWKQNQLGAYGQMGNIAGQARQGDLGTASYYTGSQQSAQAANDQTGLGYGQLGLGYGNLGATYGNMGLANQNAKVSAQNANFGLQNDVNKADLNAAQNYEQNVQNYYLNKPVAQNKSTDYTPYIAGGAAALATLYGGPGAGAAAYTGVTAIGEASRS